MRARFFAALVGVGLLLSLIATPMLRAAEPFAMRGYYTTFMRMPTFGLPEWKQMIDCMHADGANTLLLWTAGAFRSKKFPITWEYNKDHANVKSDYARELIDYAHTRGIKVVLCFTPFAYDGVNQYPLAHPEVKATQANGQPASLWGMHSWGYNLCPSKPQSQELMLEYAREMLFDFYPNADGAMIESSDYAICFCDECRGSFFEKEFRFVRQISDELWARKPGAVVMVYPHYFTGRKVPGFDATAAKQPFDARWTLFFTPHSAQIDPELLSRARTSVLWTEGLTLGTPAKIREGARTARRHGIGGFIPSLEPFSCIDGPPGSGKPRQKPFHFEWLRDGEMPLDELPMRINRIAYREYARNPELSDVDFTRVLPKELLGQSAAPAAQTIAPADQRIADILFVQETLFFEADWFTPSPILRPARLKERAEREKWQADRLTPYRERIARIRQLEERYRSATGAPERELHRIVKLIADRWRDQAWLGNEL